MAQQERTLSGVINRVSPQIYEMNSIQQVYAFYSKFNQSLLFSRASILSIVLSLVITKGLNQIQSEVDDIDAPLIGLYGHSTQELVNLFLSGKAVTNVFDGNRTIGVTEVSEQHSTDQHDGFMLRGIHRPQLIGYLTEVEALRYCEVGQFYKFPVFPIWVLGNPNHFTTIFSLDPRVSRVPVSEKLVERLALAFDNLDLSHSGIISSSQLLPLLRATGMLEYQVEAKQFLDPPGQGGVILKMEFVHWAEQKKLSSSASSQPPRQHPNPISSLDPPKKFVLYHYNGQGAAGPVLTRVLVEPLDLANIQDEDPTGLGLALRTRWKNCLVAPLPLLH